MSNIHHVTMLTVTNPGNDMQSVRVTEKWDDDSLGMTAESQYDIPLPEGEISWNK